MTLAASISPLDGAARAEPHRRDAWWRSWIARPLNYRAVNDLRTALVERDLDRVEMLLDPGAALVIDSGSESSPKNESSWVLATLPRGSFTERVQASKGHSTSVR